MKQRTLGSDPNQRPSLDQRAGGRRGFGTGTPVEPRITISTGATIGTRARPVAGAVRMTRRAERFAGAVGASAH